MAPYYDADGITIWHGDCRDIGPSLPPVDLVVADPPYGETSLLWDRWPDGWIAALPAVSSLWCFGSARMFDEYRDEFTGWKLAQDVIWDKGTAATGMVVDRFLRSHEHIRHYYRGQWAAIHHAAVKERVFNATPGRRVRRPPQDPAWHGARHASDWEDDGTRYMLTVWQVSNLVKAATHPTEKPLGVLLPIVSYACPPGGTVLDPMCGSGSTLDAARATGRRAIGIDADERWCEIAAHRLAQGVLFTECS